MQSTKLLALSFIALFSSLLARPANAATYEWYGTNGVWSASTNWVNGVSPSAGGSASDSLLFGSTPGEIYTANNDLGGTFVVNELILSNTLVGTVQTNSGNQLQFDGVGAQIAHKGTAGFRVSNDINIVNGLTVTGNGSGQLTLAGQISGSGPVVKSGTHTTVITGNNTYTGGTAINGGSVIVNNTSGSGLGSGNVTINNATLTGTGTVSGNVAVNSGGVLAGTLTVGDVVVGNGGVFAPGSKITSTSTTWQGGGEYAWSIANTLTGAGIGWDLASINGTLSIQSSLATPFLIAVSGTPANFNTLGAYSFAIATASGGISGFDESKFQLDVSGFGISTPVGARWWVSNVGNSIYVNYAIPEPSTIFLFAAGVTLIGIPQARKFWQRRTRR